MNAGLLENAIERVVGATQEPADEEYYSEYTGLNAFYHQLAGTQTNSRWSSPIPKEYVLHKEEDTITLEGLGDFVFIEKSSKYNEMGDLDESFIFRYNGRYYRKEGALDSWEGGVWDGPLTEVYKVEKVVEVWEEV